VAKALQRLIEIGGERLLELDPDGSERMSQPQPGRV
jgi:hypothetical protein